jgi:hypothetical protein
MGEGKRRVFQIGKQTLRDLSNVWAASIVFSLTFSQTQGLIPSTHSSGGKTYYGPIMKSGSKQVPEMDNGAVRQGQHEGGAQRNHAHLLHQDQEEEG